MQPDTKFVSIRPQGPQTRSCQNHSSITTKQSIAEALGQQRSDGPMENEINFENNAVRPIQNQKTSDWERHQKLNSFAFPKVSP